MKIQAGLLLCLLCVPAFAQDATSPPEDASRAFTPEARSALRAARAQHRAAERAAVPQAAPERPPSPDEFTGALNACITVRDFSQGVHMKASADLAAARAEIARLQKLLTIPLEETPK